MSKNSNSRRRRKGPKTPGLEIRGTRTASKIIEGGPETERMTANAPILEAGTKRIRETRNKEGVKEEKNRDKEETKDLPQDKDLNPAKRKNK